MHPAMSFNMSPGEMGEVDTCDYCVTDSIMLLSGFFQDRIDLAREVFYIARTV